ncbi:glycosyltransferase family 2 protein, partial [Nonlabens mediterrranea]|nr:glycosyltransferase family 2 protein [Nonlabens mediterrranea]
MISLVHHNDLAISQPYEGLSIIDAIYKCALKNPDEYLIIHKQDVDVKAFKEMLPELSHKAYFFSNYNHTNEDLGYVEDSPFINVNKKVKYPTWMKGTSIVCIHSKLVNSTVNSHSSFKNYLYWLNSIGKMSQTLGVLNYQIPTVLQNQHLNTAQLYKFVKQHYKTRWVFILLFCHLWYEKRFPFLAFIKSFYHSANYLKLDVDSLQKPNTKKVNGSLSYDVVIPTMGRTNYLKDVIHLLN